MNARSKFVAASATVALSAALLPGAMASGSGTSTGITGGGLLRLHLSNTTADYFEFDPPDGSNQTPVTQSITTNKCATTLDNPSNPLVTITPTPAPKSGAVGLFGDGLGVKVSGEGTGTPCGRVDGLTQSLTLALAGPTIGNKVMTRAELDIEGKFDVIVR